MKKKTKTYSIVVSGLLDYLAETDQSKLLPQVTAELRNLVEKPGEVKEITVTSFLPLTPQQLEVVKIALYKFLNLDLPVTNKIDKKLLGGFTVAVGDWFLDASLAYELRKLKQLMLS